MVVAVPAGVKVVERGRVVAVDGDSPKDVIDVRYWVVMMVAAPPVLVVMRDWFVVLVTFVSARDTMLPVFVADWLMTEFMIIVINNTKNKLLFETRVRLAVPDVGMTVTDSLPIVEELDVDKSTVNIDGRSIPSRNKNKVPMWPGIFVKNKIHMILTEMLK